MAGNQFHLMGNPQMMLLFNTGSDVSMVLMQLSEQASICLVGLLACSICSFAAIRLGSLHAWGSAWPNISSKMLPAMPLLSMSNLPSLLDANMVGVPIRPNGQIGACESKQETFPIRAAMAMPVAKGIPRNVHICTPAQPILPDRPTWRCGMHVSSMG
jgi:hypothetical protein